MKLKGMEWNRYEWNGIESNEMEWNEFKWMELDGIEIGISDSGHKARLGLGSLLLHLTKRILTINFENNSLKL